MGKGCLSVSLALNLQVIEEQRGQRIGKQEGRERWRVGADVPGGGSHGVGIRRTLSPCYVGHSMCPRVCMSPSLPDWVCRYVITAGGKHSLPGPPAT